MKIELHIDRLVLEGLPISTAKRAALGAAIERELTRLIAAGGLNARRSHDARIAAPAFRFRAGAKPDAMGRQIAKSIYGGIAK
ncbi:MAG TPA: hypothetical protein VGF56_04420 [Rhizomicrobium sp.]|jgi:hypothetical protein